MGEYVSGDAPARNPITGITRRCARAASGQPMAGPATILMKSRRRIASPRLGPRRRRLVLALITAGKRDRRNRAQRSILLYAKQQTFSQVDRLAERCDERT